MNKIEQDMEKIIVDDPISPSTRDLYPYIITQSQLSKEDIPKRQFIISEWMPEDSFGMVYAERGVGKSWFVMAMAVAIANGDPTFIGWEIHKKRSVLYIDGELTKAELKERFNGLCSKQLDNLFILPSETLYKDGRPISLDQPEEQEAVDKVLETLEKRNNRPQIIILDNLSTLRRTNNENDNSEASKILDWLISLRHRNFTVIVVHHSGKSGQQRGASIIEVPMDFVIKLQYTKDKQHEIHGIAYFEYSFDKIRLKQPRPSKGTLSLREDSDGNLKLLSSFTDKLPDRKFLILKYIKRHESKDRITIRDLSKNFGIANGTAHTDRRELVNEKFLDKKFQVTKEGDKILWEIWPNEFKEPLELDFVHKDDLPF